MTSARQTSLLVAVVAVAALAALVGTLGVVHANHDVTGTDILAITYIEHETAGDATLITTPDGKVILIDSPDTSTSRRDTHKALDEHDITTIDLMIATHKDADHIRGLNQLLTNNTFTISEIWFSQPVRNSSNTVNQFYINGGDRIIHPAAGHTRQFGDVFLEVLSPQGTTFQNDNDNSIVTLLEYGSIEVLFTGDIKHDAEQWLVSNVDGDKLDIDIMNAPHHGSDTSSSQIFISATSPELVIHSADDDNRYGHPHQEIVDRYAENNVAQLHTGADGDITIHTDGTKCSIIFDNGTENACFEGVLRISDTTTDGTPPPTTPGTQTPPPSENGDGAQSPRAKTCR